jgi:hypothetical protein
MRFQPFQARPASVPIARLVAALSLGLAACAAPITQMGTVSQLDVQREQLRQQQLVIESQWKLQTRLDSVALPLLEAAVPMCGEHVAERSGVHLANVHSYKRDWQDAARAAGLSDTASVISVAPGSAAERAGIRVGDRIVALDGTPVAAGKNAVRDASRFVAERFAGAARRNAKSDQQPPAAAHELPVEFARTSIPVVVRRDTSTVTLELPADTVCAYGATVVKDDALNAFADGDNVYVTSAMTRFATEPGELQTVVAHEIAHNAMRHMDAKKRNAAIGAFFGAILDVAAASQGVNTGGEYTNQMASLGAMTFSQDFEREADYVGMYILARAGLDIDHAANLWRRMATESPGSIKFATSHPTTAERFVRLEQAASEIHTKQAAGTPLVPEMKKR